MVPLILGNPLITLSRALRSQDLFSSPKKGFGGLGFIGPKNIVVLFIGIPGTSNIGKSLTRIAAHSLWAEHKPGNF